MHFAVSLARPSPRTMLAPFVALAVGAAAATGTYALIDNGAEAIQGAPKVIFVETAAPPSAADAQRDLRTDPHGTAATLRNP